MSRLLEEYAPKAEAARELNVSPRTLDRWWHERSGPPRTKIGYKIYYRRDALAEWVRSHEITPPRSRAA